MTHLGMLANSGAGLVIVEMTHVERRGRITHGCVGIYSDDNEAALTRVIAHCKRIGTAKFGIQIAHAGRKASAQRPWEGGGGAAARSGSVGDDRAVAIPFGAALATAAADVRRGHRACARGLRERRQARGARRLRRDRAAHGARLSATRSCRRSPTGATIATAAIAGRMRFGSRVARAVRAAVPKDYPLGARITATTGATAGLTADDAVKWVALKAAGSTTSTCRRAASPPTPARRPRPATTCRSPSGSSARPASRLASSG
jgi:2,4-dienoyl-CoA reductase-like NADH-dependent reductase (Old Yellow Enzyme family)